MNVADVLQRQQLHTTAVVSRRFVAKKDRRGVDGMVSCSEIISATKYSESCAESGTNGLLEC